MAYVAAAAAVIGAVGAVEQGKAAQDQANYQAAIEEQRAGRERQVAASDEEDFRRQQSRIFASRRAALGASGVDASLGSPLLASEDFAGESELQALRIRNGGEVRATRLEQSADLQRLRGRNAKRGSYFRAGSLLAQGGADFGAAGGFG